MTNLNRRNFLGGALALGAGAMMKHVPTVTADKGKVTRPLSQTSRLLESRIDLLINEPIADINPNIYGHFAEHLGGVIYDGIWVGADSKIPNLGGIRTALVEAMKRIKPSVIRYPGGCFADSYDWRDGVGARGKRPRRTNFWADDPTSPVRGRNAPQNYEPNSFGTNEFMRFCQLTGSQPYLAANLRGLGAQTFNEWVEYCNSPVGTTTGADLRATGEMGSRAPFGVQYWGIGNESWGCGGNFTPDEYAAEYRRFTAAVPRYGVPLKYIASGANVDDFNWTRGFFAKTREKGEWLFDSIYGFGLHHYAWNLSLGKTTDWVEGKRDALHFDAAEYYELLREADRMECLINRHWTVMGEYDRRHQVKLIVDEWGAWYRPGTEAAPAHLLGQQSTMRDALLAGLTLDTFNRHADKVAMANCAQLVNCLHSLFITHEDKFTVTPTFHVFEMYAAHQGARSVRTEFISPRAKYTRNEQSADFWGLGGSASLKGKQLTLTVANADLSAPRETEVVVGGARITAASVRVLSAIDVHAHNTFDNPRAVEPRNEAISVGANGGLVYRFAPASVTRLQLTLA